MQKIKKKLTEAELEVRRKGGRARWGNRTKEERSIYARHMRQEALKNMPRERVVEICKKANLARQAKYKSM